MRVKTDPGTSTLGGGTLPIQSNEEKTTRKVFSGDRSNYPPSPMAVPTAFIERVNLTIRHGMRPWLVAPGRRLNSPRSSWYISSGGERTIISCVLIHRCESHSSSHENEVAN